MFRPPVLRALARQARASRTVLATTVPADLAILPPEAGLPELPAFAITLHVAQAARGKAIDELTYHLRRTMVRPQIAA